MKDFSVKKLVLTMIVAVMSILAIITLSFALLKVPIDYLYDVSCKDSGWSFLALESTYIDDDEFIFYLNVVFCYIILIMGIISLVLTIISIFKANDIDRKYRKIACFLSLTSTIIYLIIGIVDKVNIKKILTYYAGKYFSNITSIIKTNCYLPFIFVAVLFIAYFICEYFIPNNIILNSSTDKAEGNESSKYKRISENERISILLKYKNLLNEEIISKEEFEIKKREILFLDEKEDSKKKKSTKDEVEVEQIKKYKNMFDEGLISEEEFVILKKKILK